MNLGDSKILRTNKTVVKKVFVIGNGCVENGTEPLQKLLEERKYEDVFFGDTRQLLPMHCLSYFAAENRAFFDQLVLSLKKDAAGRPIYTPPDIGGRPGVLKILSLLVRFAEFRGEMGNRYVSSRDIKFRVNVEKMLASLGCFQKDSAVITTNWDQTLWRQPLLENLAYLHGSCVEPMTMIFPTETIYERALKAVLFTEVQLEMTNNMSKNSEILEPMNILKNRFLVEDNKYAEGFACEGQSAEWLLQAEEIYFCGIHFNEYDHELGNFFSQHGSVKAWKGIAIVNRTKKGDKINEIEEKKKVVSGLLHVPLSSIKFYDTNDTV